MPEKRLRIRQAIRLKWMFVKPYIKKIAAQDFMNVATRLSEFSLIS